MTVLVNIVLEVQDDAVSTGEDASISGTSESKVSIVYMVMRPKSHISLNFIIAILWDDIFKTRDNTFDSLFELNKGNKKIK